MGGKGTLIIIEGSTGAQTSLDRIEGCKKALEEYPDIELVASQSANYSRAEALNVAQNLLQSYPDVDAYLLLQRRDGAGYRRGGRCCW